MSIESKFLKAVTQVVQDAEFHLPNKSYWECCNFSTAVVILAKELGLDAELFSVPMRFEQDIGEFEKGDTAGHTYFRLGSQYYDFTISQFGIDNKAYVIRTSPYPNSKKNPKQADTDGYEFWYDKIKTRLGSTASRTVSFLTKIKAIAVTANLSKLKKALSSSDAYTILDAGIKGADTWASGGCFLLAKSLLKLYPEAQLMVLMGITKEQDRLHLEPQPQHTLIKLGTKFIDSDGVSSEKSLLQRWIKYEGMLEGHCWVEPFNPTKHKADYIELANTDGFKKAEIKLVSYLKPILKTN